MIQNVYMYFYLLYIYIYIYRYLNPHGSLVNHIDAAMSNHRNNGLLCVVSTDSTHQFTRSAHTVRRHFDAVVTKTDYLKELAARVIIATIVRYMFVLLDIKCRFVRYKFCTLGFEPEVLSWYLFRMELIFQHFLNTLIPCNLIKIQVFILILFYCHVKI